MSEPLLSLDRLRVVYDTPLGEARAVDGVSFDVAAGEVVALVGESGSGKSTIAHALLGSIEPPGRVAGGAIRLRGEDLARASQARWRKLRGQEIALVFQDALGALDPVFTVGDQLVETLRAHAPFSRRDAKVRARELFARVRLEPAAELVARYPHQLSGGMRQRVALALALAHAPALLVADEPTTALDPTLQAEIVALVRERVERERLACLWITHDLQLARAVAERVVVLYAGRVAERGPTAAVLGAPRHPYTRALIAASPRDKRRGEPLLAIDGGAPAPTERIRGCAFRPRCGFAIERCEREDPAATVLDDARSVACHRHEEVAR